MHTYRVTTGSAVAEAQYIQPALICCWNVTEVLARNSCGNPQRWACLGEVFQITLA